MTISKTHELKTDPLVFDDSFNNKKLFELRFNDRDFNVGDTLVLKETKFSGIEMKNGKPLIYTNRIIHQKVNYILSGGYGLMDGWVIIGVTPFRFEII